MQNTTCEAEWFYRVRKARGKAGKMARKIGGKKWREKQAGKIMVGNLMAGNNGGKGDGRNKIGGRKQVGRNLAGQNGGREEIWWEKRAGNGLAERGQKGVGHEFSVISHFITKATFFPLLHGTTEIKIH